MAVPNQIRPAAPEQTARRPSTRDGWQRPYPLQLGDALGGALAVFLGGFSVIYFGILLYLTTRHPANLPALLLFILFATGINLFLWRLLLAGVSTHRGELRVRRLTSTTVLRWSQVAQIRAQRSEFGGSPGWLAIWVVPREGSPVPTPLVRRQYRFGRVGANRSLAPATFDAVLATLQAQLRQSRH